MDEKLTALAEYLTAALPGAVTGHEIRYGELTVEVGRDDIGRVLQFLRDDAKCRFALLCDVCGVDYPDRAERFDVVYNLLSLEHNQRIRVKIRTDEETPVPSVVTLFSCAGWWERETYDLFGVYFSDNPDLRRILTDYGFEGHPLRKDFPLTGYVELRYDEDQKRVVYEPVKLKQEFRAFDYLSPWEGMSRILPGDEKATDDASSGTPQGAGS